MSELIPQVLIRDYGSWQEEARVCRENCALFDFSFMSRVRISGEGAESALQAFQTRQIMDMDINRIRYALRVDAQERVVADLTIWRLADDSFEMMSGRHSDITDLMALSNDLKSGTKANCIDLSADSAIYAVQGPNSFPVLQSLSKSTVLAELDYFSFSSVELAGIPCTVARLGYTGEMGFEIIVNRSKGKALWSELARQARPAGFAAIDSLRIEAGFMLFANDLVLRPTSSELGVVPTVTEGKADDRFMFICCTATTDEDPTLWRSDNRCPAPPVKNQIVVTSACFSSVADSVLILGFVHPEFILNRPLLDPTGTFVNIRRVSRPFFDPQKLRPRGALVVNHQ